MTTMTVQRGQLIFTSAALRNGVSPTQPTSDGLGNARHKTWKAWMVDNGNCRNKI